MRIKKEDYKTSLPLLAKKVQELEKNGGGGVTATSIKSALGYTPADKKEVDRQAETILGFQGAIIRRTKSISGYSFTSKQYRSLSVPYDAVDGYTPIVYMVACTSHSAIRVFNFYTSSGNVVFEAVNQNETSITANFSIYFLYIKNDLLG